VHAKVYRHAMRDVVEDLKSTNGTRLVVGEKLEEVKGRTEIGSATEIVFGKHKITTADLR
jgi:hypothetical protein